MPEPSQATILIPVFNDWDAAALLLNALDDALDREIGSVADVVLVDDGSTIAPPPGFSRHPYAALRSIDVLHLRRNMGHQRAIAIGLVWIHQHRTGDAVVIMDGDGEDRPADVPRLLHRLAERGGCEVIFAERAKRLENLAFRFFYRLYRFLHHILTGETVRVGNFSVLPRESLERLVASAEIWNHYAAAVFRGRMPYSTLPLARGPRLSGHSQMNFISLLVHGISAISVYADAVAARLLAAASLLMVVAAAGIAVVVAIRFGTTLAIPGWTSFVVGILVVILLQAVMLSFLLIFMITSNRIGASFLPLRDCPYFVRHVERLFP